MNAITTLVHALARTNAVTATLAATPHRLLLSSFLHLAPAAASTTSSAFASFARCVSNPIGTVNAPTHSTSAVTHALLSSPPRSDTPYAPRRLVGGGQRVDARRAKHRELDDRVRVHLQTVRSAWEHGREEPRLGEVRHRDVGAYHDGVHAYHGRERGGRANHRQRRDADAQHRERPRDVAPHEQTAQAALAERDGARATAVPLLRAVLRFHLRVEGVRGDAGVARAANARDGERPRRGLDRRGEGVVVRADAGGVRGRFGGLHHGRAGGGFGLRRGRRARGRGGGRRRGFLRARGRLPLRLLVPFPRASARERVLHEPAAVADVPERGSIREPSAPARGARRALRVAVQLVQGDWPLPAAAKIRLGVFVARIALAVEAVRRRRGVERSSGAVAIETTR
eukprot:30918-Pelagococcus_subviridis.AAC.14